MLLLPWNQDFGASMIFKKLWLAVFVEFLLFVMVPCTKSIKIVKALPRWGVVNSTENYFRCVTLPTWIHQFFNHSTMEWDQRGWSLFNVYWRFHLSDGKSGVQTPQVALGKVLAWNTKKSVSLFVHDGEKRKPKESTNNTPTPTTKKHFWFTPHSIEYWHLFFIFWFQTLHHVSCCGEQQRYW